MLYMPIKNYKNSEMKRKKFEKSVIVVGAGAAGITAAALLKSDGFDVTILEASDRIGGRILPDTHFAPFPIDMGAEFIHGHRTEFYRGIKKMQLPMAEEEGVNYFWYKNRLFFEDELPENEDFEAFYEFVEGKHQYRGKDNSVANFLKNIIFRKK
jgi:predicted NAD/FAD-dependent oxidoreductase